MPTGNRAGDLREAGVGIWWPSDDRLVRKLNTLTLPWGLESTQQDREGSAVAVVCILYPQAVCPGLLAKKTIQNYLGDAQRAAFLLLRHPSWQHFYLRSRSAEIFMKPVHTKRS
jgi:hypothetical protein